MSDRFSPRASLRTSEEPLQPEDTLHESEARFRTLIENSNDMIIVMDSDATITYASPSVKNVMGYTPEALIGQSVFGILHPDDLVRMAEEWQRIMQDPNILPNTTESRVRHADGTWHIHEGSGRNLLHDPVIHGFILNSRDITQRKQTEEQSRKIEQRYRALFERTSDSIFILDLEGKIIAVNQQTCQLLGYTQQEMEGMSPRQIVAPEEFEKSREVHRALLEGKALPIYERTFIRKDGTCVPAEISIAMVYDQTGEPMHIQSIVRDISARKREEAEREKLMTQMEAKNAELERFTYTVSHDLKSPLITIRGFLGFIEKDAINGNSERLKRDIQRISEATNKMQRLLDELLELSRIGRMMNAPEQIAFGDIVRDAVELVTGQITARGVQVNIEERMPVVIGDRARLIEVVQNLLDNAVKFMGDQSDAKITIGTHGADANGKPIFFVRDNGIGIDPRYQNKIFGLFNKLDAQTDGTGVGLALVKRIIEIHSGQLWVESDGAGKGCTFFFTLPNGSNPSGENR